MVQIRPILGRFCTMRYKVTDIVDRGKLTGPKGFWVFTGRFGWMEKFLQKKLLHINAKFLHTPAFQGRRKFPQA